MSSSFDRWNIAVICIVTKMAVNKGFCLRWRWQSVVRKHASEEEGTRLSAPPNFEHYTIGCSTRHKSLHRYQTQPAQFPHLPSLAIHLPLAVLVLKPDPYSVIWQLFPVLPVSSRASRCLLVCTRHSTRILYPLDTRASVSCCARL
jgi:hypothetical protein